MDQATIITIMQDAISTVLTVALPPILIGLVVGIIISIFQAATQINEQTLTFVPKIIAILVALLIFGGMMLNNLTEFTTRIYEYAVTVS
ncbi:flagellar biosynthesis protein FliQ [Christensenella intestinihominis]|uniref:flagellar biosynthesis protein FliQ n=1 Tax=Christensenella intestinihominis TaxID=1851429 RepID=UPI0008295806|nr:flagellar biosynthesis protein FliQ [Christensenella intestinihominis]